MAWPTTTISTANVDAGTDNPANARADIESLMDGHNDVVASFGTSVKTSAYTVLSLDDKGTLFCDASSASFTVTMLPVSGISGFELTILKTDSSTNTVTIDGDGTETINQALTQILYGQNASIKIITDGTSWLISVKTLGIITGYDAPSQVYVISDDAQHDNQIMIDSVVTVSTWESIGPTGSGADNVWVGMDDIPAGAKWIEIASEVLVTESSGTTTTVSVYARKTGSSATAGVDNRVVYQYLSINPAPATSQTLASPNTFKINIDSTLSFDIYWDNIGTVSSIDFKLVAFGM